MRTLLILALGAALVVGCGGSTASNEKAAVSTPTPKAAFTEDEIVSLTTQQVVSAKVFPPGAKSAHCVSAYFKPAADMWVVTCDFYFENKSTNTVGTYTVSDKDGKLVQ